MTPVPNDGKVKISEWYDKPEQWFKCDITDMDAGITGHAEGPLDKAEEVTKRAAENLAPKLSSQQP